jgi:hypothetical protein
VIHHVGDYAALGHWYGGALAFFIYQAAAITFEDAVIAIAAKFGFDKPTPLKKVIGYLWVAAWLTHSMPMWWGPHMTGGYLEGDVRLSPIMGLSRGEWYPKPDPVNVLSAGKCTDAVEPMVVIEFVVIQLSRRFSTGREISVVEAL